MTDLEQHSLGDLVATHPGATRILDRAGLDYCCRGNRTLADACASAGLNATTIAAEIEALATEDAYDWTSLNLPALADHVVAVHHRYLRDELPLLEALAGKVDRAHGERHPELSEVRTLVKALRADLEPHLDKEERILFPAIRALADGRRHEFPFGSIANPIRVMVAEHDQVGELLASLRTAANSYEVPADGCASYRALYERLEALEYDTHVHIHKENHVLFSRAMHRWDELTGAPQTEEVAPR